MPTDDQIASRKKVAEFIEKVGKPIRKLGSQIKSEWFGRPDKELKGWLERGQAIAEIEASMGYRMIMAQTEKEIRWAQGQLEVCDEKVVVELRMYLRSLRFLEDFILTVRKNADIASTVLAGRESAIGLESHVFVKNARVEEH